MISRVSMTFQFKSNIDLSTDIVKSNWGMVQVLYESNACRYGYGIRVSQIRDPLAMNLPIEPMGEGILTSKYEPPRSIHQPENSIWSFTTPAQYCDHD